MAKRTCRSIKKEVLLIFESFSVVFILLFSMRTDAVSADPLNWNQKEKCKTAWMPSCFVEYETNPKKEVTGSNRSAVVSAIA
jgi:hypothetical protein